MCGELACNPPYVMFFGVEVSAFWHNCTLVYSADLGLLFNGAASASVMKRLTACACCS